MQITAVIYWWQNAVGLLYIWRMKSVYSKADSV